MTRLHFSSNNELNIRMKKTIFLLLMLVIYSSSCSQEGQTGLTRKWKLIDDPECPDFIEFKGDGKYVISNDCSIKVTDTIYHPDIFTVEKGSWKLKNDRLMFYDRKMRQYSSFHEFHGVKKELQMKINFRSRDTLQLFFKENGNFNLNKFESYIHVN